MFSSTEPWKAVDKPVPLEELKSVPADSESIECAYAIWQRRDPENGSFRKGKKKRCGRECVEPRNHNLNLKTSLLDVKILNCVVDQENVRL